MTPEVRERIEQIRHGIVPEGYIKSDAGIIPASWQCNSIGNCLIIKNNERKPISEDVRKTIPGQYPYYGPTQAQGFISTYESEGPAVLIGEDGDHFLKYKFKPMTLWIDGKYTVNNHAHMICGTDTCDARWFYYVYEFKPLLNAITRQGAGRYKLTKEALEKLPVQLPTSAEQKKIAEILTAQDKVIELKEKRFAEKQQQKKYLAKQVFDKGQNTTPLAELALITMGQSPASESYNTSFDGIPLIQGNADILNRKPSPRMYTTAPTKMCSAGDILISVRAPVGTVAQSTISACIGRGICSIHPRYMSDYIYEYLLYYEDKWGRVSQGSTFESISGDEIGKLRIPLHDESSQFAKVLRCASKEIELLRQDIEQEKQKKKALMQLLLTGIVRVNV